MSLTGFLHELQGIYIHYFQLIIRVVAEEAGGAVCAGDNGLSRRAGDADLCAALHSGTRDPDGIVIGQIDVVGCAVGVYAAIVLCTALNVAADDRCAGDS